MALRTPLTVQPHMYIGDSTGRPLDYGMVYFGEPDKDPEFYPIDIFSDDELTVPISQPARTKGGYLNNNKGDMAEIHAQELIYSVKVLDQYGRKIFYKGQSMRSNWNDDVIVRINEAVLSAGSIAQAAFDEQAASVAIEAANSVSDAITDVVLSSGFVPIDSFELGATITQRNEALRHAADGKLYRWAGDLPKVVPVNSTPTNTGGFSATAWLEVSDTTLRQEIVTGGLVTDTLVKVSEGLSQANINNGLATIAELVAIPAPKNGMRVFVKSADAYFTFDSASIQATNTGAVFQGVGGKWEMELQSSYYASMFCPASSIDNVNEPQEDNINAGYVYATSKGRPFIIDNDYYVASKQTYTTQTTPTLSNSLNTAVRFAIRVQSNSVLVFQNGAKLKLVPNADYFSAILLMFDVENYIILDPHTVGDRDTHLSPDGEQGINMHFGASKNGYVRNPICENAWGDGMYFGFTFYASPIHVDVDVPTDIVIDNPKILNSSRNAISLCGGDNICINNPYVFRVNRTAPLAGIDIEPEEDINYTAPMFIRNCTIHNATFVGCGYAISQNVFGNRDVEVSFTGVTTIKNVGEDSSWIPMLLQSSYSEGDTYESFRQNGHITIEHVVVDDTEGNLAFQYLAQVKAPENGLKIRIKHYEFTSSNFLPKLMFLNSALPITKCSGFSMDKVIFNRQINYVDFVFDIPEGTKPKINYNLNFDDSLNIQYQNKGFEFYGSCYIGGWSLVNTPIWEEKSHINNVLFIPANNGEGSITSYGTVTNKYRDVLYALSPKGSDHTLGLTVISQGFAKRSTTDCASIRLVNMSDPIGTKILSIYGDWIN